MEPQRASEDHYGCPFPRGPGSLWPEERGGSGEDQEAANFWQTDYAESFVRAVYLSAKAEEGRRVTKEGLARLFAHGEVGAAVRGVVRREGSLETLREYERGLRELIRREKL